MFWFYYPRKTQHTQTNIGFANPHPIIVGILAMSFLLLQKSLLLMTFHLQYGFAGGDLDAAERIEVDSESEGEEDSAEDDFEEVDEEEREVGVDARAGKVDVLLPPLDFEPRDILNVLTELRNKKETTTKARKTLIQLISK